MAQALLTIDAFIASADERALVHYHRGDDGGIVVRVLQDGALHLDSPRLEIAVAELFPAQL